VEVFQLKQLFGNLAFSEGELPAVQLLDWD